MDAVLRLDEGYLRLDLAAGQSAEVLRWPLVNLEVETTPDGDYLLHTGSESFTFAPQVDDGLGHEIALRTKFASAARTSGHDARRSPPAERIRSEPLHRRRGVLTGADLGVRTATIIMGILAVVVVAVAAFSGRLQAPPTTPSAQSPATLPFTDTSPTLEAPPTTLPSDVVPDTTPPPAPTSTAPAPSTTTPLTTTPPTTVPPTTAPPTGPVVESVFALAPEAAVDQWDALAVALGTGLAAEGVSVDESGFSFQAGDHVTVSGTTGDDGVVAAVEFRGDPSGTVADDRQVLTALGVTVALVEPTFSPAMRRDLLESMGLDVDQPQLAGLDGSLTYSGVAYAVRWDGEIRRLIFTASR